MSVSQLSLMWIHGVLWFCLPVAGLGASPNSSSNNFENWKDQFTSPPSVSTLLVTTNPVSPPPELTTTRNQVETTSGRSKTSTSLVIGLSVGFGVLAGIVVCGLCICCCSRRKPSVKQENHIYDYTDDDEDSAPYRIVDLSTNISCDSSGYTFLDVSKKEEEKPYQKLLPCNDRPETKICDEKKINEVEGADEPVYFLLEAKPDAGKKFSKDPR